MPEFEDIQVIIPYSRLCDLLDTSRELKGIRNEIKILTAQQTALRGQFMQLMEMIKELM